MAINNYSLLSLIFFALALLVKSVPDIDVVSLKILNTLMFNEVFFSYFTELGNGLICLAIIIPVLSLLSFKTKLNNVKIQTLVMVGLLIGLIVKTLKELADQNFRSASAPSGDRVEEGDTWYDTDDDQLKVYRETSSGVFAWVPIMVGNISADSDTVDAGSY